MIENSANHERESRERLDPEPFACEDFVWILANEQILNCVFGPTAIRPPPGPLSSGLASGLASWTGLSGRSADRSRRRPLTIEW